MTLTELFNSLKLVDKDFNKYTSFSKSFNNCYRFIDGYDVFRYDKFPNNIRNFVTKHGYCIAMPNYIGDEVVGLCIRSLEVKEFRVYTESKYIPHGSGFNINKPFYKPWIIVESVLDSDFLRQFYPYVIATYGVSISTFLTEFLKGTCSTLYVGFDNDNAGNEAFKNLVYKLSGDSKCFHVKRLYTPKNFDGNHLKDFGEIIDYLYNHDLYTYDYYVSVLKTQLSQLDLI